MPTIFDGLDKKKARDIRVLASFVSIYCRQQHRGQTRTPFSMKDPRLLECLDHKKITLCPDCQRLLSHGIAKRLLCPYDPKPACRRCPTHCYAPSYREKMREVMRFSGMHLIKRGRLDLLLHYLH